ncbi:uncharacterized protein HD556DRAFT_1232676 [Suillus plorans]|uniref:Nephrocystin 3-like N-terminal domain-containing protein n=1 Tax=Suillus plorans TaxID=116603 RepID=A0A9P7DLT3_9AGAM|nr:uncharacterized protein HD556DRAFT_1232676 [Suillus plorans]KAG1798055.1 hypothetical protein HD556DRAFT_1232676 [Suillus plorans]
MIYSAVRTVVADTSSEEKIFESLSAVVVHHALYDCPKWGPRDCLDGTCTKILEEIETALQAESSTLIWLSGSPGTGKSAIAHTIASRLKKKSKLAGTFFFSRQHKDIPGMASLDFFAPTLAYQISRSKHLAKDAVIQSIRSDPIILDPRRSFTEQIQGLLVKPLQNLQVSWRHLEPKAFVIDAIDACEEGRICEFISCLSNLLHQPHIPHLHIVITSRPLHAIDDAFEAIGCEESIHHIALDDVDVTEDLRLLFKCALEKSYRHHGLEYHGLESDDQTILCLADRASGRFRGASMMIRFLETDDDDEVPCNLDEKIDLMKDPGDAYLDSTQIFRFYEFVINLSENPNRAYRHLSTVVNLAKPLAILHLRKLLGSSESDLLSVLASLSPIVSVPVDDSRPVEVLHIESLREFLSQHPSSSCASQLLAQSSLRTMRSSFLRQSGLKDELQQMGSERNFSSSPALRHACQYWGWYLSQDSTAVDKRLRIFLRTFWQDKLLSWFERQWYLEGLESCIAILTVAQTIDFNE